MSSVFSNDFVVAAEIYRLTRVEKGKAWYVLLSRNLKDKLKPWDIVSSLCNLRDFGIVYAEYGETEPNRVGRLYYISDESMELIKSVYEELWRNHNKPAAEVLGQGQKKECS